MASILIIDDDLMFGDMLSLYVRRLGHQAACAHQLAAGLAAVERQAFDVIYLDVRMPDGNGLDLLPTLRDCATHPEVIIITGQGDPDGAELAIKSGAWDYIEKAQSLQGMTLPLIRALQYREGQRGKKRPVVLERAGIIGESAEMQRCLELVAMASDGDASVLIGGETGSGKELIAAAIHRNSSRARRPFVVVDCAALPETLVESLLFGHVKGAFTGADRDRDGLILQASGGTLFLDEIGELPLALQRSFLRVVQERRFRPLGGTQEIGSDFRLIAATHRNLEEMVRQGTFRQDLLFRLRSLTIDLPPLRQRKEDIKSIAMSYLNALCERNGIPTKGLSPDFFEALMAWDWPGNVRELLNTLESVFAITRDESTLFGRHLPVHLRAQLARQAIGQKSTATGGEATVPEAGGAAEPHPVKIAESLQAFRERASNEAERAYLEEVLAATGGDVEKASERAGISISRLYSLLKKHQLGSPRSAMRSPTEN